MKVGAARVVGRAAVAAVVLFAGLVTLAVRAPRADAATFGRVTPGATIAVPSANYKFGSSYSLPESATVQSFSFYAAGGPAAQRFTPAIYAVDASGNPTTRLATASEVIVAANQPAGWVTTPTPAVNLTTGTYFLALVSGPTTAQARVYYDVVTNAGVWNQNAYPTPSATWGAVNREAFRWSFYVTYNPVAPPGPPVNTALPTIAGTAREGQTLTASPGTWTNSPASYAYQWRRCDSAGNACTDVGSGGSTYGLGAADVASTIRVIVTATNGVGSASATSAQTAVITAGPPVNTALPSISGAVVQGQTLSASTGTWTNSPASYAYQWRRCDGAGNNCANVGANTATYLLGATDVASTMRVVVTATNAAGSSSATSAQTAVIASGPPTNTALPTITGTTQEGATLTATNGTWTGAPSSFAHQWRRCDTAGNNCANVGANATTYVLALADVGSTMRVVVTASNGAGPGTATSNATAVVTAASIPVNTALPAITGTAQVGATLTATNGTWMNNPTSFARQWRRCDNVGANCTNVGSGATTYVLVAADIGSTIRVVVSATNVAGTASATSVQTGVVAAASTRFGQTGIGAQSVSPDANYKFGSAYPLSESATTQSFSWYVRGGSVAQSFVPAIYRVDGSGNPSTLVVAGSAVTVAANQAPGWVTSTLPATTLTPATYFLTLVSGPTTGGASNYYDTVTNAGVWNTNTYPTPTANWGVVNREDLRWSFYVTYAPSSVAPPSNTALPTIAGVAQVGQTLTASTGTWLNSPTSYAYQWQRCNASGGACAPIASATAATYQLVSADIASTIRVAVTATNAGGSATATSAATAVVTNVAAPVNSALPSISGVFELGQSVSASTGTWSGNPTSFAYQWQRCNASGGACAPIASATGASYVLASGEVGSTVRVAVTATNAGGSATATSNASAVVTLPPAPVNTALPAITGVAQQGLTLSASTGTWSNNPSAFAYQWQRCNASGGACANLAATANTYALVAADVGSTIRVAVTATNAGGSATATSTATAVVTAPPAPINTALPTIAGSAVQGQTLTTTNGTWTNNPATFAYQWRRCDAAGNNCTNIGTGAASYALVVGDVGSTIRIVVTATNAGGSTAATSNQSAIVAAAALRFGQTTIGSASVAPSAGYKFGSGYTLAQPATIQSFSVYARGGSAAQSFVPVVYRSDVAGNPTTLAATGATLTIAAGQAPGWVTATLPAVDLLPGTYFLALVSGPASEGAFVYHDVAANAGVWNENAYPTPSATWGVANREDLRWSFYVTYTPGAPPQAPVNTTLPSIAGAAAQGQQLTAGNGAWTNNPTSFAYQWQRCNSSGGSCTNLAGATAQTYLLVAADVGSRMRVVVTASNSGGSGSATSAESAIVTTALNYSPVPFTTIVIDPAPQASLVEKTLADIDNDGRVDAVVGFQSPSSGGLFWYESPHSGNLNDPWIRHTILPSGEAYEGIIAVDLDGDGRRDVIASVDNSLYWYRNPGTPNGTWTATFVGGGNGENDMELGDFDGDGRIDIMTSHTVFFQNSTTNWFAKPIGQARRGVARLSIGSALGAVNLVTTGEAPNYDVVWYENPREHGGNARTDAWIAHVVGSGYTCESVGGPFDQCPDPYVAVYMTGDLNGDGRMDIVASQAEVGFGATPSPGGLRWFEAPVNRTQPWAARTIDASFATVHNIRVFDVDGNGMLDVIAGEGDDTPEQRIAVFYNVGGSFVRDIFATDGTHSIAIADVSNDGDIDILASRHGFFGGPLPLHLYVNGRFGPA